MGLSRREWILRSFAGIQFALAFVCALFALASLQAPPVHDELGLAPSADSAFEWSCAFAAVLLAYGGLRAWRLAARWWLPGLIAIVGVPVLFLVIWVSA